LRLENKTAVEFNGSTAFLSFGNLRHPKPRAKGAASGLVTRSRWRDRFAPFSRAEKEMVRKLPSSSHAPDFPAEWPANQLGWQIGKVES
jgi:hypothetical protein